jgi:hypothetical protein
MSDPATPENELRLLEQKRSTVGLTPEEEARLESLATALPPIAGFDVNAAAAEVRAAAQALRPESPVPAPAPAAEEPAESLASDAWVAVVEEASVEAEPVGAGGDAAEAPAELAAEPWEMAEPRALAVSESVDVDLEGAEPWESPAAAPSLAPQPDADAAIASPAPEPAPNDPATRSGEAPALLDDLALAGAGSFAAPEPPSMAAEEEALTVDELPPMDLAEPLAAAEAQRAAPDAPADPGADAALPWAAERALPAGDSPIDFAAFEAPVAPDGGRTMLWAIGPGGEGERAASPASPGAAEEVAADLSSDAGADALDPCVVDEADILDVGDDVVEVAAEAPAGEMVEPPAAAVDSFAPLATDPPLPADHFAAAAAFPPPEPVLAVPPVFELDPPDAPAADAADAAHGAPSLDAFADAAGALEPLPPEPEPPPLDPAAFVAGRHRVVLHTSDGEVKRGVVADASLDAPEVVLAQQTGASTEAVPSDRIKAIFFMLPAGEKPPAPDGKRVRVTFRDGRQVAGFSADYGPERPGFFMVPADTRTHTARIWVYRSAVRQVSVM